jgi:hypothetical protein
MITLVGSLGRSIAVRRLKSLPWLLLLGATVVSQVAADLCRGDDCCRDLEEPRIKFLDDLAHPFRPVSHRDPYEERIETERHDFTQSTTTVGRGVFQLESGYTYFYKHEGEDREASHTTPELTLRLGLSEDIEFRLRWNYAWRFIENHDSLRGSEDMRWSLKFRVTDQEGWLPESALVPRFSVPTGGKAWSTERMESGLDYIYGWEIVAGWELYGSTGYDFNALGDFGFLPEEPASERFNAWHQSVALGTELTERMTMYNEWVGIYSRGLETEFSIGFYNIGIDYYISDNFVLDVRIGFGLTPDADDFFSGVGGGYRF